MPQQRNPTPFQRGGLQSGCVILSLLPPGCGSQSFCMQRWLNLQRTAQSAARMSLSSAPYQLPMALPIHSRLICKGVWLNNRCRHCGSNNRHEWTLVALSPQLPLRLRLPSRKFSHLHLRILHNHNRWQQSSASYHLAMICHGILPWAFHKRLVFKRVWLNSRRGSHSPHK